MHAQTDGGGGDNEDAEQRLARALAAQRARLLRRHAHRLDREDLEECLAQAALELVPRARGEADGTAWRPALALEQRFLSRVSDRRRALAGRSPREHIFRAAIARHDANLDEALEIADPGGSVDEQVVQRDELRRLLELVADLTEDQRLVAIHRLRGGDPGALRLRQRWSVAKYEKVASRATAQLRMLRAEYDAGERCRRLAPELHAAVIGGATAEQRARAARHVRNCRRCATSMQAARRRRQRQRTRPAGGRTTPTAPLSGGPSPAGTVAVPARGARPVAPRRVGTPDVPGTARSAELPC